MTVLAHELPAGVRSLAGVPAGLPGLRRDVLPVAAPLDSLFPYGGMVRGSVIVVERSTTVALALLAAASAQGSWCAAVGLPALGHAAAAEHGIDLTRLALVPAPGERWATAVAVLLDGVDAVLVRTPRSATAGEARRVAARVREQRGVLLAVGGWPDGADLRLTLAAGEWSGLEQGYGRLAGRRCDIRSSGRGAAARERRVTAWLP